MKPFLENSNIIELEAIQNYMDKNSIQDPELLTEKDYDIIQETLHNMEGFESRFEKSINHMVKFRYQAANQKRGWMNTVANALSDIHKMSNAQINPYLDPDKIEEIYQSAISASDFKDETGMDKKEFPKTAKEALGTNDIKELGKWEFVRDYIEKYSIHSDKDENLEYWEGKKDKFSEK